MTKQILPKSLPAIKRPLRLVDLTGRAFGRLSVVRPVDDTDRRDNALWLCRCSCGNDLVPRSANQLRSGLKSCGCSYANRMPSGVAAKNETYKSYSSGAQRRGLEWDLSMEDFLILTSSDCHYCGAPPSNLRKNRNGSYKYNGIDRVDNRYGYYLDAPGDNVVPCCKICNVAKGTASIEEFLAWIDQLTKHQQKRKQSG